MFDVLTRGQSDTEKSEFLKDHDKVLAKIASYLAKVLVVLVIIPWSIVVPLLIYYIKP